MNRHRRLRLNESLLGEVLESRHMLSGSPLGLDEPVTHEIAAASSSSAAIDFFRLAPLGGLSAASLANVGAIADVDNDEVDFTFFVEAGESVSAVVTPSNAGAVITVGYVELPGASATASAPGESAVLDARRVSANGIATIRVTANLPTDFTVDIYRNTVVEAVVGESGSANKLSLAPSQSIGDGVKRFAALGSTSLLQSQTVLFRETFDGTPAFATNGLWHTSEGRASDGQPNHAGAALYFGHAEQAATQLGTLHWDAELDSTSNSIWESTVDDRTTTRWNFGSSSNPGSEGEASNLAGVKEWYAFGSAATMDSLEDSLGDEVTENDASFELVFRPRDFNGTHVLFETGGNVDGTTILLDNETLEVRVQDNDESTERVVRNFSFDAAADVNEFHHIAVTIHPSTVAAANQIRLFVNGVEAGGPVSATGVLADWGGTDDAGLGRANGAFADSDDTTLTGDFDGDIASLRFHQGRLLNVGEVIASYGNLVNDLNFVIGNYDTGEAVGGEATSPPISLVSGSEYTLSFDTLIEVEEAEEPFELLQVIARNTSTADEEVLLDRFDGSLPGDTDGAWSQIDVDLSSFAGQSVQIIFRFDSGDDSNNHFEGWWIDNVNVTQVGTPTVDDDQFTVDLTDHVGQAVDIVLAGQAGADYSEQTLELWDPTGVALLATGVSDPIQTGSNAANYDLGILDFEVTTPGIYTVRVVADALMADEQYGVLVLPGVAFETEPNEDMGSPRTLNTQAPSFTGYLRADTSQVYASRAAFVADNAGLSLEDFEGGNVDPDGIVTFSAPLTSQTANGAFPSGIVPGVNISGTAGSDLALVGANFFDLGEPGSQAVGADSLASNTTISFTGTVTAVGFDILGGGDITVRLFDQAGGTILSTVVAAEPTGAFFGATSSVPIGRVELIEAEQQGELLDNIAFGNAGVAPAADADSFIVSLAAGETVHLETATPLDAVSHSPLNSLNPQLEVTGSGTTLSDLNSASDGKNSIISFTAAVAGDYVVRIAAESGEGEYVVQLDGALTCQPSRGDIDGDGLVGFSDFLVLSREFGSQGNSLASDLDCDDRVGFSDFLILSGNFGTRVVAAL